MRKPTVLLIATTTGYQIRSFGDAAQVLGVNLVFASDRCDHLDDPWRDRAVPVRFHEPAASVAQLRAAFADRPPDGIVAVGDRPAVLAAYAAAAFGLQGNTPTAAVRSRNKLATREALTAAGLPVPSFLRVPIDVDPAPLAAQQTFPVVVKPLALSGSRGVMRADDPQQFVTMFERLQRLLRSADIRLERDEAHGFALIESFIDGREYAVEGVLTAGECRILAIFDKPDPLDGPFFEETIYVTPSRAPMRTQTAIVESVAAAARAIGLDDGPLHAECRVNRHGVYVLEVAARPIGGLCSRALRFTRGGQTMSLEEMLLRHALRERLDDVKREDVASGVMMIPIPYRGVFKNVDGLDDAKTLAGIDDLVVTAKSDAILTPLPEGRSYLGFIFARGATPDVAEDALRRAHQRLRFRIDREVPVVA